MTLVGIWENAYGSRMTLSAEGDAIAGVYESTTGSTGQYLVSGWQLDSEPTAAAGQPVSLAIEWHSVVEGPADASWNWVSALGGQINIVDGEDSLILSHLMIASSDFEGLADSGVYVDKLTYHRVTDTTPPSGSAEPGVADADDPLSGEWTSADGAMLSILVTPDTENRFGYVSGTLAVEGSETPISGFTDVNATADGLQFQSVSIIASDTEKGVTRSLGGWIELATGVLSLQLLTNHVTAASSNYVQTDIRPLTFEKVTQN
ncbi:avidin/streptavidin family protein [Sphingobium xenophagum]|jgi:hypothetical protein|uniref:avidin/streptavidin family protein n=1 Tax=Sphingobium TaxID=165695 RepID=UPI0036D21B6F